MPTSRDEEMPTTPGGGGYGGLGAPGTPPAGGGGDRPAKSSSWKRNAIEWIVVIAGAVAVALIIQATSFQAFFIPSSSMESTLNPGDRVLVNKWSYRLHPIHRGDIVVFHKPKGELANNVTDLIKRVIGLPGESITIANNHVYVNGHQLIEPYLDADAVTQPHPGPYICTPKQPCTVPKGDIWVMGDNRVFSEDSRYFGPIPESSVIGRAFFRIWPINKIGTL
jgi:signal peptidase I